MVCCTLCNVIPFCLKCSILDPVLICAKCKSEQMQLATEYEAKTDAMPKCVNCCKALGALHAVVECKKCKLPRCAACADNPGVHPCIPWCDMCKQSAGRFDCCARTRCAECAQRHTKTDCYTHNSYPCVKCTRNVVQWGSIICLYPGCTTYPCPSCDRLAGFNTKLACSQHRSRYACPGCHHHYLLLGQGRVRTYYQSQGRQLLREYCPNCFNDMIVPTLGVLWRIAQEWHTHKPLFEMIVMSYLHLLATEWWVQ